MKNSVAVLRFLKDGTVCGLYTEVIDLGCLGRLTIQRATVIEFDDADQLWRVMDRSGRRLYASRSRNECLKWERDYFNQEDVPM